MGVEQGPSLATCTEDNCFNMYALRDKLNGKPECPGCRGSDEEPDYIEENPVTDDQKVWT